MKFGIFKARAVLGSEQYGDTTGGHPQIAINLRMKTEDGSVQEVTTFLIFSAPSAPYSFERLRAMGWEGNDLTSLKGIDKNEVDVRIWEENYEGKPQLKVEIMGGGRVQMSKPTSKEAFAAKVAAITGQGGGAPAAGTSKPPF